MIRTQEQIKERFEKCDDLFGTQQGDLIQFMTFESAKEFLKSSFVDDVENGKESWIQLTDPKEQILKYLEFAFSKAEDQRGLSAARSMLHFKTWIWLDDDKFYDEIIHDIDNYTNYGLDVLKKIANHYKWVC